MAESFPRALSNLLKDEQTIALAIQENPWFTREGIQFAIENLLPWFEPKKLRDFADSYPDPQKQWTVAIIMAGNIPLAGMHDLICVLLSGHTAVVKCSSKDKILLPKFCSFLPPEISERISFGISTAKTDFLIATGSNNSARYFEDAFRDIPMLIRKNRWSVAVLRGDESDAQLQGLAKDILTFAGLGCRNVNHLLVPATWSPDQLLHALDAFPAAQLPACYFQTMAWESAVLEMGSADIISSKNIILKPASSPLPTAPGILGFSFYTNEEEFRSQLQAIETDLQVVAGVDVPFGQTQQPALRDFADGADTMEILTFPR